MTSTAETLLSVQLEQAGIPFEREYVFAPEEWCRERGYVTPKRGLPKKWRADFALWDIDPLHRYEADYLIEVDGGTWTAGRHTRGKGFEEDCIKLNAAAELGYRVLRFTTGMVNDGSALAQIRRILSMNGENRDAA